jgi:hypothetical protein
MTEPQLEGPLPAIAAPAPSTTVPLSSTATSAATEASTPAFGFGPGFVDVDRATADLRTIQSSNCLFAIFVAIHLDEAKAAGAACVAIGQNADALHLSVALKSLPQLVFVGVEAQIPHKNILHASSPALSCWKCELSFSNLAGLRAFLDQGRSWLQSNAGGSIAGFPCMACQFTFNLQIGRLWIYGGMCS